MIIGLGPITGERPGIEPYLLEPHQVSLAHNVVTDRGDMRPWKAPSEDQVLTLSTTLKTIFEFKENSNEHWIESANDVDHIRSPVVNEQYERVFFTGEAEPRFLAKNNVSTPFNYSTDYYKLGIPAPTSAPTVGSAGAGAIYRAYFYIYVNSYGEPGPASAVDSVSDYASGYATIEDIVAAPTGRAIDAIWLYRTNVSTSGVAKFQFVLEATWFNTTTQYAVGDYVIYATDLYKCTTQHAAGAWNAGNFTAGENVADADLGAVAWSLTFEPPPSGLKGLGSLDNGVCFGFSGNTLYLSEPFYPHAWPYSIPFARQIVAVKALGNSIAVMTDGEPSIVYGSHPSAMGKKRIASILPCKSKRGAACHGNAVYYPSVSGFAKLSPEGAGIVSTGILDKSAYEALSPSAIHGVFYDGKYFGFNTVSGFVIDFDQNKFLRLSSKSYAEYISIIDNGLYIAAQSSFNSSYYVKKWEGDPNNYLQYTVKSRLFSLDYDLNFPFARVILDEDFYDDMVAALDLLTLNQTIIAGDIKGSLGSNPLGTLPLGGDLLYDLGGFSISAEITFKLWCDGEIKFMKSLTEVDTIFPLPADFEGRRYMIEVTGFVPAKFAWAATSIEELQEAYNG